MKICSYRYTCIQVFSFLEDLSAKSLQKLFPKPPFCNQNDFLHHVVSTDTVNCV